MKQVRARIASSIEVMPETRLMWLEAPEIAAAARPGQFVMVRCAADTVLPRPFSVHRVAEDRLALLFNIVGRGTRWLYDRPAGETLDIFGLLGNGFEVLPGSRNLLLVAGGIGVAPLRFMADVAAEANKKVTFILGARTADRLLPVSTTQRQFDSGVDPCCVDVVNATDDGSEGYRGPATDLVPAYLESIDQVFACGPQAMYRTMAASYHIYKRPVQVSMEIVMGCGTGVCYGCTIRTISGLKQVCKDGPVFDLGDIIL
jgi:dihydroorotate dehydrogenase electron transfer subunit